MIENNYPNYSLLLYVIFPEFRKYINSKSNKSGIEARLSKFNINLSVKCRIYDPKYFELYYSFGANEYSEIYENVVEVIDLMNSKVINSFDRILAEYIFQNDNQWLEQFEICSDVLEESIRTSFLDYLMNKYNTFPDICNKDLGMNDRNVVDRLIIKFLIDCNDTYFSQFINKWFTRYEYLNLLYHLKLQLNYDHDKKLKNKRIIVNRICDEICVDIIDNNISIFDSNYKHGNLNALCSGFVEINNPLKYKCDLINYVHKNLNSDTIYMILDGCANIIENGNGCYCELTDNELKLFDLDRNQILSFIKNTPPSTDYEVILKDALKFDTNLNSNDLSPSESGIKIEKIMEFSFRL